MDIVMNGPDISSSRHKICVRKDFVIPCDAKDLVQRPEAKMYDSSEKTANDVSRDMFSPANELSMHDLRTQNSHTKSCKDSNEVVQDTVQISSEKGSEIAQTESTAFVSATEKRY
ncbi:hypothetical protein M0R45_022072 [Rubus argutus]|uniref:Uncharacterized protein n=1 Tax=Rubus argutus TaxID=59490 RepID=A0AAW1XDC4_RUBAR